MISDHLNVPDIWLSDRRIQVNKCEFCNYVTIYKIKVVPDEELLNQMGKGFESRSLKLIGS